MWIPRGRSHRPRDAYLFIFGCASAPEAPKRTEISDHLPILGYLEHPKTPRYIRDVPRCCR